MKLIYILALIFCVYASFTKAITWFNSSKALEYMKSNNEIDLAFSFDLKFQSTMAVLWTIFFLLLIIFWLFALLKRAEKLKIYIVSLTLIGALFMNITDSVHTEVYLSDIIVGSELLESKPASFFP
jgi:hypothetical protein